MNNLYITISQQGDLKAGTCDHCVIREQGRPKRAWEPDGDRELDFDRDALIARLASLGVVVRIDQEYVCP
ncbi:MAG TPA: hypothetical protein VEL31_31335 [Ktedonobacteraceae bacterium]|nr:hypothetical protein [Ktedonobacteraceae bacterium]